MRRFSMVMAMLTLLALVACQAQSSTPSATSQPPSSKSTAPAAGSPAAKADTEPAKQLPPTPAPVKLKVGYSSISGPQSLLAVTQEAGIFAKYGLDLELIFFSGGSKAAQALMSGDPPMALTSGSVAIEANLAGADVVMIATPMNTLDYVLIGARDVKKAEDLKGRSIAISRFGSQTDFVARYILRKNNLEPGKQVAILEIGEQPQRYAALESGAVAGALIQPPFTLQARAAGYNELSNLADEGLELASTTMATSRAYIKANPDTVERMVKALVEGIAYYKQGKDKEVILRGLGKYFKSDDRAALEETMRNYGKLFSKVPVNTQAGVQGILDDLVKERPEAKDAKLDRFVDEQVIHNLQSSGFIDALYK